MCQSGQDTQKESKNEARKNSAKTHRGFVVRVGASGRIRRMKTAIIADDDEHIRNMTSEMLEASGVAVLAHAKDGKEAVEYFERLEPNIVVLDVSMPNYDGVYALERIRRYDSAKIIMVTGDKTEDTAERLRKLGPVAVLYKPYDFEELLKVIDM